MALGGGVWFTQNKKLPGSYINFISIRSGSVILSERGVVALAQTLDWGVDGEVMEISNEDFMKNSLKLLGYEYTHAKLKGLRDLFLNARTVYLYKLNSTTGNTSHATCTYGTAVHSGIRGNDLKIKIAANADDSNKFDVTTILDDIIMDVQVGVASAAGLVDNDWIIFDKTATLATTAGTSLTGGANATATSSMHQAFLDKLESIPVNAVGCVNNDSTEISSLSSLYVAWCKRMRDDLGIKLQVVVYNNAADYEGVVNVCNAVSDSGWSAASAIYWVLGVVGATAVNASATNKVYDGEFTIGVNYTQSQLEAAIDDGKFMLHKVGDSIRVLTDINSFVSVTTDKGELFKSNQTIRVIDNIANDIADLFNTKYLGKIPNDSDGRVALWADIVAHHRELERIRAIENFDEDALTVEAGNSKRAVVVNDAVIPVNAMEQLYMTCVIS